MSARAATDVSTPQTPPATSNYAAAYTTTSTSANPSQSSETLSQSTLREAYVSDNMDEKTKDSTSPPADRQEVDDQASPKKVEQKQPADSTPAIAVKKTKKCRKPEHKKKSKSVKANSKKSKKDDSTDHSSSDDSDDSSDSTSTSEDDESSAAEKKRRKAKNARSAKKAKSKKRKSKARSSNIDDSDDDSESASEDTQSSSDGESSRRKKIASSKKSKKAVESDSVDEAADSDEDPGCLDNLKAQVEALKLRVSAAESKRSRAPKSRSSLRRKLSKIKKKSSSISSKRSDSADFKRVDQLWDSNIHNYKLKESAEDDESEFADYAFLVRRRFDWENKYTHTVVDIKSKDLRAALSEVMKDCKSVSLEAEEPTIDPNLLFLYLEELRTYYKKTLKSKIKAEKKRKAIKKLETQRALCKTLAGYLDEDYADTKKTLYPLLEAGNITFDLLWALFHPNEIAITSTYGVWDEPRCFKVEYANKFSSMTRGEWYCVEGRYMEYDGKTFGFGDFEVDVDAFKGPRKITSLATYPLKYHKDAAAVKKQIIERGKRFVETEGMNYRFHKGLAFMKKKKQVAKININGRVMIDPATFRRINPNYHVSLIKARDSEELFSDSENDDSDDCSCCGNDSDAESGRVARGDRLEQKPSDNDDPKVKYKYVQTGDCCYTMVPVEVDENGDPIRNQKVEELESAGGAAKRVFTEEELLLTTSVVLGFAFSEKLWLEFSLSGVRDIEYNENAFESLVLPPNQKSIVRALVESHKFHAAKTIDDVVQGKGKGLVAVLHGPPGTGKTLTAEGISELLKCPLYMVSAGELGTDPARLELELQKILDIAHSWGAVLLLDEADVFLEKRETHDIYRNALVSIFLRLLEYFQGILFLTTNRVETFDDAFQSRIHVALRYGDLTTKAKKSVWTMFLDLCRKQEGCEVADLSEADLDSLSRHQLNGRQIKNVVRTAQALALNEKEKLTLEHIKRVLDVAETFDRDLKGGTGYIDAMRSYT